MAVYGGNVITTDSLLSKGVQCYNMPLQHTRDYDHGYVKASARGSGYLVYLPKGLIESLPDGAELCEAEELEVKRYASRNRNHIQLTLREAE